MKLKSIELFLLSTAVGIIATFAAPWVDLRGTYAAWRIVEWHTFWRGEDAFQLASVVSSSYRVPIEYATTDMQAMMRNLFALGSALGAWHIVALIVLLVIGARWRLRNGASMKRTALEIFALVIANFIVLYLLSSLLALPSTLTPKVDFRTTEDIHTNSLIWSSVNILPVAPLLAGVAVIGQMAALGMWLRIRNKPF
ncbi:MAG: hypothetical protein HZB51_21700 [Chloroflexi bacterium]|nr:hypothetical protein [Chloroflexota bacterium]